MSDYANIQLEPAKLTNKKQNTFIAKCSLIAGSIFAIIFAISYVIGRFGFDELSFGNQEILIAVGSISLIVALVLSMILSFKGMSASYGLIISMYALYSISMILMFSGYFSLIDNSTLFYSLAFTALALLITGLISYIIPAKVAFTLAKISSISLLIYLLISIFGSLLIYWTSTNYEIWQIIVTAFLGFIIICSTIYTFYSIKSSSEFMSITELDSKTSNKFLLIQSFNLLSSIVMIFMLILRIVGLVNNK